MKVRILAKNFKLTPTLEVQVAEKLVRPVTRLLGSLDQKMDLPFDVELAKATKHHKHGKIWYCEVNLIAPFASNTIRARAEEVSIFSAIDEVKYEIEREIKKYKDKFRTDMIRDARRAKAKRRT
ncbi:MAG: hypothetical protein G01um101444_424 [Parcubacteria group bacterium Gr01-1014_44]|nr:MAG: hypothetical protein G01um101444_424 [Parcubacteria group bacterium Gr01-1014_44]